MTEENLEVYMSHGHLIFYENEDRFHYYVTFRCENKENNLERGDLIFTSEDGEKWSCTFRHINLRNLKLDHIFTDSIITKHLTEVMSKQSYCEK